ncbi:hypothetical protein D6201_03390 [Aurantiacibacter aquimixticola]|uniref:Uncharacterized protein n=1 Tax=Aurantiacibacter aquimixticola TaxID=1958945 RepID=A0A419RRW8_9SPHN|nr:hypothetical protein D6201_03390 [Aurantiacibacter aquimixticola]
MQALLKLDARLAQVVANGGEVLIRQMRLAWWRDAMRGSTISQPIKEPLMACLSSIWKDDLHELVGLVDGWEALLEEALDELAIEKFVLGRTAAWASFVSIAKITVSPTTVERAVRTWALAGLAANVVSRSERDRVLSLAAVHSDFGILPRRLRPLAILAGLGRRGIRRGGRPLMEGRGAALRALKIGAIGR